MTDAISFGRLLIANPLNLAGLYSQDKEGYKEGYIDYPAPPPAA